MTLPSLLAATAEFCGEGLKRDKAAIGGNAGHETMARCLRAAARHTYAGGAGTLQVMHENILQPIGIASDQIRSAGVKRDKAAIGGNAGVEVEGAATGGLGTAGSHTYAGGTGTLAVMHEHIIRPITIASDEICGEGVKRNKAAIGGNAGG